jgi:hypothetical protein
VGHQSENVLAAATAIVSYSYDQVTAVLVSRLGDGWQRRGGAAWTLQVMESKFWDVIFFPVLFVLTFFHIRKLLKFGLKRPHYPSLFGLF